MTATTPSSKQMTTPDASPAEFTITDAALSQVRQVMDQQKLDADEKNLRIFVEGGGCCGGVGFGLAFDRAQPDDVKLERGGLTVVIDPQSFPYVAGATIDFVSTPEVTGFKVSAPPMKQEGGGCGGGSCGSAEGEKSQGSCGSGGGGGCGSGGGHSHGGHSHGGHEHGAEGHGHSHGAPKQGGSCGSGGSSGCC